MFLIDSIEHRGLKFSVIFSISRRDSGGTDCLSDQDCQSFFFCKQYSYVCIPCTYCIHDNESVGDSCSAHCMEGRQLDPSLPAILMISLAVTGALVVWSTHVYQSYLVGDDTGAQGAGGLILLIRCFRLYRLRLRQTVSAWLEAVVKRLTAVTSSGDDILNQVH